MPEVELTSLEDQALKAAEKRRQEREERREQQAAERALREAAAREEATSPLLDHLGEVLGDWEWVIVTWGRMQPTRLSSQPWMVVYEMGNPDVRLWVGMPRELTLPEPAIYIAEPGRHQGEWMPSRTRIESLADFGDHLLDRQRDREMGNGETLTVTTEAVVDG